MLCHILWYSCRKPTCVCDTKLLGMSCDDNTSQKILDFVATCVHVIAVKYYWIILKEVALINIWHLFTVQF